MRSRKTRLIAGIGAAVTGIGLAASLAATSASASGTPAAPDHFRGPQACAWDLNGVNVLDLTFQGSHFQYPIRLHVARNGAIFGTMYDQYLAAEGVAGGDPSGILRISGDCDGSQITLDTLYPSVDPQGLRGVTMLATPVPGHPHHATVAGVWDETGPEAGAGSASLVFPVHAS
jgi:hypothetical protein